MIRGSGHSYFSRSRFRSPRSQPRGRTPVPAVQTVAKADGVDDDEEDSFTRKLDFFTKNIYKKEPVEDVPRITAPLFSQQFFKAEDGDDEKAYGADGTESDSDSDSDSDDSGKSDGGNAEASESRGDDRGADPGVTAAVPGQHIAAYNASHSLTSQPATPNMSSKPPKLSQHMGVKAMAVEELYPGVFLPLNRANLLRMVNENMRVDTISYPWKKSQDIDRGQLIEMKAVIINEAIKQFIAFSTNRGVGWAVKTKFPWVDCSTQLFRVLRYHGQHNMAALKHELIYERIYTYLLEARHEYPHIVNLTGPELVEFLGPRFNKDLARSLWPRCSRVLDVDKTFADDNPNKIGAWYMRQVFLNMSIKLLPVICTEVKMNPTRKWIKKTPSGWVADRAGRENVNWFFDCLCVAPEVNMVEMDSFEWIDEPILPRLYMRKRRASMNIEHGHITEASQILFHATPYRER
ncbi:hypothetical protein F4861DRAFT_331295 [Xylaria intraflava]|nr:hypothetical protein F4861DRAFT_331295 [Xylaria intraflava]